MPIMMHFSTFLKLLTRNTGEKIRDLEKYAQPGGFDFYRTSRDGVSQLCGGGRNRATVISYVRANAPQNAIDRNVEIVDAVDDWLSAQAGTGSLPNRGIWSSPNGVFSVHVEPEVMLTTRSRTRIVAVYPRSEPRINRDQAGAGIILLRRSYRGQGNEQFGILDAIGGRAYWAPTNISSTLLNSEIAFIENELRRIIA